MKEIRFVVSGKLLRVAPPDAGRTTGKACFQKKTPEVFDRIERNSPWMIGKSPILPPYRRLSRRLARSRALVACVLHAGDRMPSNAAEVLRRDALSPYKIQMI